MNISDFKKKFHNTLIDKLSKENKQIFLLGDFNINLLHYNDHQPTNEFLDSLLQIPLHHTYDNQLELLVTQKPS